MDKSYDMVVVGAGSAGLTAANLALQLGASVAIVEKGRVGGDCTWTGCVPSKTLLKAARVAHEMRNADMYGLTAVEPKVDFKHVMVHIREIISRVYDEESAETLRKRGIDVYEGEARFVDAHTVAVGDTRLDASRILLSTGARPIVPLGIGLEDVDFLTYESVWDLETLPSHLIIIGAGPVGCELAQAFRRLGSQVTLVDAADRVLLQDDSEASTLVADALVEGGIDLRLDAPLEKTWMEGQEVHVVAGKEELVGDALLLSLGRRPDLDELKLGQAEVDYDDSGITVNENLQTSQSHIYAAGDCISELQFTHYAGWQGFMAARNALLPGVSEGRKALVPWATFTDPEVAHVGLTEEQAEGKFGSVTISRWPMNRVDRALTEGKTTGFIKLVYTADGTPVGVTIVADRASEMIHEWVVAMDKGLKVSDLASSIHIYPTYSLASMEMAAEIRVSELLSGLTGRALRNISRLTR